mgnify:CR=1 FL=1
MISTVYLNYHLTLQAYKVNNVLTNCMLTKKAITSFLRSQFVPKDSLSLCHLFPVLSCIFF